MTQQPDGLAEYGLGFMVEPLAEGRTLVGHGGGGPHSGIGGMNGIIWETGWAFSVLGNYDAHFTGPIADDIAVMLSRLPGQNVPGPVTRAERYAYPPLDEWKGS